MEKMPFFQEVLTEITPGLRWSEHFCFGFLLRGSVQIRFSNHVREYLEHDMLFFMPFETWSVVRSSPDAQLLLLRLDGFFLKQYCPDLDRVTLQRHHLTADLANETYRLLCADLSQLLFNEIKQELTSRLKSLSAVTEFFTHLIEAYGSVGAEGDTRSYHTERSIRVLSYLAEHYTEHLTVPEIARETGLHPQYFSTWFKAQFGTGFIDYLTAFRVNHTIPDLLQSEKGILDIALDHGFANHKTYAAAFRRVYGCSPREYRKREVTEYAHAAERANANGDPLEGVTGSFAWFRQFLNTDRPGQDMTFLQTGRTIELDPALLKKKSFLSLRPSCLSAGRAYACLRSNLQEQIKAARRDLHLSALRIRDIFSDSLYIYYEDEEKRPIYNWQTLDSVFDFLLENEITPFPEISYMPERLAAKKQYAGYQYRPNVSRPKSMELWKELIRNFLRHYIARYGIEEVRKWDFDFWISPDLNLKMPYWYGTMEEFFDFYRETYNAFQEVDPALRLGSANFSSISGYPWYHAFFTYCREHKIHPAFLSMHLYGSEERRPSDTPGSLESIDHRRFSISNPGFLTAQIKKLREIAAQHGFSELPLTISDWSLSFLPRDLVRETCYMGPWICYNYVQTLGLVDKLSFWALSDIHEEAFPESTLFYGGPGTLDYHGLKKASYNTLSLLSRIGSRIYATGDYYLFARRDEVYQILLFHLVAFDDMFATIDNTVIDRKHRYNIYRNANSLVVNILLHLPKGTYLIRRWEVNRSAGSAYDLWAQVGFPEALHKDVEDYIEKNSVPRLTCEVQEVEETLLLDETLPAHGVMLLEIEKA